MTCSLLTKCLQISDATALEAIDLFTTLLQHHFRLIRLSRYPLADKNAKLILLKHNVVNRLWKECLTVAIEFLKLGMPDTLPHMETFSLIAYRVVSSLLIEAPEFESDWFRCLGELAHTIHTVHDDSEAGWEHSCYMWCALYQDRIQRTGEPYYIYTHMVSGEWVPQVFWWCKAVCVQYPETRYGPQQISELFAAAPDTSLLDRHFLQYHLMLSRNRIVESREAGTDLMLSLEIYLRGISTGLLDWSEQG